MFLRKPVFWIVFCLAAVGCGWYSVRHFSEAFSIVNVPLKMDRAGALTEARAIAAKNGWGPEGFRQAAAFSVDAQLRDFVQLEAGGKDAFNGVITQGIVFPYTWNVRHFRQGDPLETVIAFSPEGGPVGFVVALPENQPGNNVPRDRARKIAEQAAAAWGVSFSSYALVEQSSETKLGGRIDHTFVYELAGVSLGEGRYRVRLTVSGDRFTELARFVKIPAAFGLRYQKMRSANTAIASTAQTVFFLLYVLGGCVGGIFFLLSRHRVLWKAPLLLAAAVALLQVLADANAWPLEWMAYDTAVSYQGFVLQHLIDYLRSFASDWVLLALSFMAAEGLTRTAFPGQIQLWKLWSPKTAASVPVAGRTAAGYLLVSVFFAYEVALYFLTRHWPHWWAPSDTIYDPNILATWLPWLTPFAQSTHAGIWEESLFRAVPLAGAALLGSRFGKRTWWIAGALLVQAVIFGAAHANYPNQPSYARLVEIIIPAVGFGLLYLYFGLLPGIILHFSFDAVNMALPVFITAAPGSVIDKIIFLLLLFIPVWVVLINRLRARSWAEPDVSQYNRAWAPPPKRDDIAAAPDAVPAARGKLARGALLACIPLGAVLLAVFAVRTDDVPPVRVTRQQAIRESGAELKSRGIALAAKDGWRTFTRVTHDRPGQPSRFVWGEGGKTAYRSLQAAGYLAVPSWQVRYARFGGTVSDRSEEYLVDVSSGITSFTHQVPEDRPGADLDEDRARSMAGEAIVSRFGLDPSRLLEIGAQPSKLPRRTDWNFEFQDPARYPLKTGQQRIAVSIAGGEVNGATRYVYVPEQWQRRDRDRNVLLGFIGSVSSFAQNLLFLAGAVAAVLAWTRRKFSLSFFLVSLGTLLVLQTADLLNGWPAVAFSLSAVEPLPNQLFTLAGSAALQIVVISGIVSLLNGRTARAGAAPGEERSFPFVLVLGWALFYAGGMAAVEKLVPSPVPLFPDFGGADARFPALGIALAAVISFIKQAALLLLLVFALDTFTARGTRRAAAFTVLLLLLGLVFAGRGGPDSVPQWIAGGLASGILLVFGYWSLFRFNIALVPPAAAVLTILGSARQMTFAAFPGAVPGHVLAVAAVAALGWYWSVALRNNPGAGGV